jgi:hypothetical protein
MLFLVDQPDYTGDAGIHILRGVQRSICDAMKAENWDEVRRLDAVCASVVERLIAHNANDNSMLVRVLGELKGTYGGLLSRCEQRVLLMQAT